MPTKVPTKHPSGQNRKLSLSRRALHHDDLTPEDRGAHVLASGPCLTASLTSDDSSSHPLTCCAVACPFSSPHSPVPQFPRPRPVCPQTNQTRTQNISSPVNTLWASWSGNRPCCRWGHVGAGQAMQRTCFLRRTAQHTAAACDTLHTAAVAIHVLPRQPRHKSLQNLLPRRSSRLMFSRFSAFSLRSPASLPA